MNIYNEDELLSVMLSEGSLTHKTTYYTGLSRKFIQVFPYDPTEKSEWIFWPTQYEFTYMKCPETAHIQTGSSDYLVLGKKEEWLQAGSKFLFWGDRMF